MIHVVDASAIGALLFGEADGNWVRSLITGQILIVPAMFHFELGNVCWLKLRRHPQEAGALLNAWLDWNVQPPVAAMAVDFIDAMRVAHEHNLTFYDASYLWLARDHTADLISLDARLVRTARSIGLHAPTPGDTDHSTPRSRN